MPNKTIYLSQDIADQADGLKINYSKLFRKALLKEIEKQTGRCVRCGKPLKEETGAQD